MTTAKQVWEAVIIECRKQKTQPMTLEAFNYLFNKAIYTWYDNVYHAYDINQKMSDNIRVLISKSKLDVKKSDFYNNEYFNNLSGAIYECNLPLDYLHMINCTCVFELKKTWKCYQKGDFVKRSAIRMTGDIESQIEEDFYLQPSIRTPYFFINNVNENNDVPTNPFKAEDNTNGALTRNAKGNDLNGNGDGLPRTIKIGSKEVSQVEREAGYRYGNKSPIRMEIRYGYDDTVFELKNVYISYLKTPQNIILTKKQFDLVEDTSQILEFPDGVVQEIINVLVALYMENIGDQRVSTNMQVNKALQDGIPSGAQSIAQQVAAAQQSE